MKTDVDIAELAEALPWVDAKITSAHLVVLDALISYFRAHEMES